MRIQNLHDDVVLLNEAGDEIGSMPKAYVHGDDTALHLAFSCYLFDERGRILMSRRALGKQTWPGVWTNSFCGHPRPSEPVPAAVRRRADLELGIDITNLELALPLFRYRATDASGVVENEICPVYLATCVGEPQPNPREVMEVAWVEPHDLTIAVQHTPWAFSPWLVLQSQSLTFLGGISSAETDLSERERLAG
jgi:isopentenyl-diphosphate Delta-isomerase